MSFRYKEMYISELSVCYSLTMEMANELLEKWPCSYLMYLEEELTHLQWTLKTVGLMGMVVPWKCNNSLQDIKPFPCFSFIAKETPTNVYGGRNVVYGLEYMALKLHDKGQWCRHRCYTITTGITRLSTCVYCNLWHCSKRWHKHTFLSNKTESVPYDIVLVSVP